MDNNEELLGLDQMNKETKRLFMAGLCHYIKKRGLTQAEVAINSGTAASIFSRYKTGEQDPGKEWRDKIISVLDVDESDLVAMGKSVTGDIENKIKAEVYKIPSGPTDDFDPDHLVSAMMAFARQHRKTDDRLQYWRGIYENLPVSVVIVKDGVVTSQNLKAKEWGQVPGAAPCEHCLGRGACDPGECAIKDSMRTGSATTKYKNMGGEIYKVMSLPVHLKDADYFIATSVHIDMAAADAAQKRSAQTPLRRRKEDG